MRSVFHHISEGSRRMRIMKYSRRPYLTRDEIVANFLKIMIENGNDYSSQFLRSQDVYCKRPRTLFKRREPLDRYFLANRTENSGKTDGCESGCWRAMGRDKLIKSEENETIKILGFKKVFKFCEKEKPKSNRRERDEVWVMEEYRLASKWKQDYAICKIRLMICSHELELFLGNHIQGYSL